jgi:predicted GNAT family acetyltransferase
MPATRGIAGAHMTMVAQVAVAIDSPAALARARLGVRPRDQLRVASSHGHEPGAGSVWTVTALRAAAPDVRGVRTLAAADLSSLRAMLDADPFSNAVLAARLDAVSTLEPRRMGGEVLGIGPNGAATAACYSGGNLLPVGGDPPAWNEFGEYLGSRRRMCSSIVGPAETVSVLWSALSRHWAAPRAVRACQPLLVLDRRAQVAPDPLVRHARIAELDRYLPAAAAMFGEELGMGPLTGSSRVAYRSRLAELIVAGRAFVRVDECGEVVFKAELAAVSRYTSQVQGVWVRPDCRGRGIASGAMAAVIEHALRIAPTVSLYVNDFNLAGRRLYERLGMRQIGTLSTVLF